LQAVAQFCQQAIELFLLLWCKTVAGELTVADIGIYDFDDKNPGDPELSPAETPGYRGEPPPELS
jgi:hypothetical protein